MAVNAQRTLDPHAGGPAQQNGAGPAAAETARGRCPCFLCQHQQAIGVALVVVIVLLALIRAGGRP